MNKIKYTVVGIAPKIVQEALHKLKDKFNLPVDTTDYNNHFILKDNAHFAIKRTFYLQSGITEENVIERIKSTSSMEAITICCTTTGMFPGSDYGDVLYIKIGQNKELLDLHMELSDKLSNITETKNPEMEKGGYVPHLSMVYNIQKENTFEINDYIEHTILPLEFSIGEILLLKDFDANKDERELVYRHTLN